MMDVNHILFAAVSGGAGSQLRAIQQTPWDVPL